MGGAAAIALLLLLVPRTLIGRGQDRLAREGVERKREVFKLLTRADLVAGRYRRVPGILGLSEDGLSFKGLFGETFLLPTSRIQKIATGRRLCSGRLLLRREVLRITRSSGEDVEFVLTPESASAWRSHLGLWAVRERQTDSDGVAPGR